MRKSIITSAILLGALSLQAGSFSFVAKSHKMNLSDGNQIEILLQQEVLDEDLKTIQENQQTQLTFDVLSHEKMLEVLKQIRKEEQEVNEELNL